MCVFEQKNVRFNGQIMRGKLKTNFITTIY